MSAPFDPDSQAAKDVFAFIETMDPAEALNAIGFLADRWSGPRVTVAIRVDPTGTALVMAIMYVVVQELAMRVAKILHPHPEATRQLSELINVMIADTLNVPGGRKRR